MTKQNLTDRLLAYLQEHGLVGAREVMRELKISQPTFSRLVAGMHDRLCIVGEARSRRYALRRNLLNFGSEFPIYAISENGEAKHIADLKLIAAKGFLIVSHSDDITSGAFPDIPYWLNDLRPSGFLGRLLPTKHPELGYPSDIRLWSSEACIHYWLTLAWDLIGNLIIGERTFRLYHEHLHRPAQPPSDFSSQDLAAVYKRLAREVLSLGAAGSSAGGEQPKFLTERPGSSQPVLVKFSPPCSNEVQKRRGDLLVCEHICLSTLREQGIPACVSRLVAGSEQIFLELERFDRVAASGRRGVISLGALSAEFVGSSGSWRETAKQLLQKGRINPSDHDQILWRYYFGMCIANPDMHPWNLSFFCNGERLSGLAPVYDMLPMAFAPNYEQLPALEFKAPLLLPEDRHIWESALKIADVFWERIAQEHRVDASIQSAARLWRERLANGGAFA